MRWFVPLVCLLVCGCGQQDKAIKMAEASCQITAQTDGDKEYHETNGADGGHASVEDIASNVVLCMRAKGYQRADMPICKQEEPDGPPNNTEMKMAVAALRSLNANCYEPM